MPLATLLFILLSTFDLKAQILKPTLLDYQTSFFKSSNLSSQWGLSTWRWKEGLNDSLGVLLSLKINWEKELIDNWLFQTTIDLKASKSRLQQHIFGSNDSGIYFLREAKLIVLPTQNLSVEAGVLSEAFWKKDLLISSSTSFIGSRQSWRIWNTKDLSLDWNLEQSVPPSASNDSYRLDNEVLPSFFITQWSIDYKQKQLSLKSNLFYAQYFNLPAVVAYQSGLLGNSVLGENASDSQFPWGFGLVGVGIDYYYPLWGTGLESYVLWNYKADSSVGKARFLKLYFDQISLFSQDLILALEEFFIEPDATVSYYNSATYGNTNREGFAVALSWKINSFSKIGLRYIQSNLINTNAIQNKLQSVSLGLESEL